MGWRINRDQTENHSLYRIIPHTTSTWTIKICFCIIKVQFFVLFVLYPTPEGLTVSSWAHVTVVNLKMMSLMSSFPLDAGVHEYLSLSHKEAFIISLLLHKSHGNSLDAGCVQLLPCVYIFFHWQQTKENIKDQMYRYAPSPPNLLFTSWSFLCLFCSAFCLACVYVAIV